MMGVADIPFTPRRGLRGGHLQTIVGNFLPRRNGMPAGEDRAFSVEDEAQVVCRCHWQPGRETRLTVIIVHGLEGSVESQYVVGTGTKAWDAGMNVVRMNMRNCGGTESLTPTLYHSGLSADVGAVAKTLIEQDSLQQIALVGYSMGGNLVLKLAGDWGGEAPPQLRAVAAVSPAMDLAESADAMHTPANWVYEQRFLRNLRRRLGRKARLFPGRYDVTRLRGIRSIRDFDERVTAFYCGFTGADDYYYRASSARVLERIAVSTLVLHAQDDPFIRVTPETRTKLLANPHIRYVETAHGGHCAFLADPNGYDGRWAERTVIEFFQELHPNALSPRART
jgi:predicted alpha/beta-fold hydrolase